MEDQEVMIEIARSIFKKRFLTLKNFLWLFIMFAFLQFLDEILESWGIAIENSHFDYAFDGFQMFFIGCGIYIFLYYVEKNVQNALLKDSFLRAMIENMDEGVSVCDNDGNLVFMNDTYAHRMNHDKPSYPIPYEKWSQYMEIYEENGKSQIKLEDFPLLRVLKGEELKQQVIVLKPIGKPIQYISVNGKRITSKYGEKIGALVVLSDITEQKQAE
jgi:PAS domain-containing protein